MKVVVTGACGRFGPHVVKALQGAGMRVRAVDINAGAKVPFKVRVASLLNREACYELLDGADAVVHLGNHSGMVFNDHQRVFIENTTMNMNVFQAAAELKVPRIVFASSIQVISGSRRRDSKTPSILKYLPLDSDTPAQPGNAYAASKLAGEALLEYYSRNYGTSCVAIRFPQIIDMAFMKKHHPGILKRRLRQDWIPYNIDEALTHLDSADGASLIERVLASKLPGFRVYLPAAKETVNLWSPAEAIRKFYPRVTLRVPAASLKSLVDTRRITAETGWRQGAMASAGRGRRTGTRKSLTW